MSMKQTVPVKCTYCVIHGNNVDLNTWHLKFHCQIILMTTATQWFALWFFK